jgi:AAA+ superfamily predicted ATPase
MNTQSQLLTELRSKLLAGSPGFYVQSAEEERVDGIIRELCALENLCALEWHRGYGWIKSDHKTPLADDIGDTVPDLAIALAELLDDDLDSKLVVIKGARLALENNGLAVARLQHLMNRISRSRRGRAAVVLVAERLDVPAEIESHLAVLPLALPTRSEIETLIAQSFDVAPEVISGLAIACGGLSQAEIFQVLAVAGASEGGLGGEPALRAVLLQKQQVIAKGGALEMVDANVRPDEIGGLQNLKDWLVRRATVIHRLGEAAQFGVRSPKGVLIAGMPGCGKSLTAKVTAALFGLPLLRLDIGSLLGKYVGESEHNMRRALHTAESISPCVLWIDELEKAFVGMGGSNASEVTSRLLGYFLTWMQEKSGTVFTIATANDVTALPPELLRKGRFDEIFYVGFPSSREREEIIRIHLQKAGHAAEHFDVQALAANCRDYSGADIENAIAEALEGAFVGSGKLTQELLMDAIRSTVSLRETMREKVAEYERKFEKLKLKPASRSDVLDIAQMIRLADDANKERRRIVAQHVDAPDDLLNKLAEDHEPDIRRAVYGNPRCPEFVLSKRLSIGKDDKQFDVELLHLTCVHPNAPHDLLLALIQDGRIEEIDVLVRMLTQSSAPEAILEAVDGLGSGGSQAGSGLFGAVLSGIGDNGSQGLRLRKKIASAEHISFHLQSLLAAEESNAVAVRVELARHAGLSDPVMKTILNDSEDSVRAQLAAHPNLDVGFQEILSKDRSADVRAALAANPVIVEAVENTLSSDPADQVKKALAGNKFTGRRAQAKARISSGQVIADNLLFGGVWGSITGLRSKFSS